MYDEINFTWTHLLNPPSLGPLKKNSFCLFDYSTVLGKHNLRKKLSNIKNDQDTAIFPKWLQNVNRWYFNDPPFWIWKPLDAKSRVIDNLCRISGLDHTAGTEGRHHVYIFACIKAYQKMSFILFWKLFCFMTFIKLKYPNTTSECKIHI